MSKEEKVKLSGIVDKIIFASEDGGTIFKVLNDNCTTTVVGKGFVNKGDSVLINGKWVFHNKFGKQLSAESIQKELPETKQALISFLSSGAIPLIGLKYATKLVNAFGTNTIFILDSEDAIEQIKKIPNFGKKRATEIVKAWKKEQKFKKYIDFMSSAGISVNDTWRIYNSGIELEDIQKDPYSILGIIPRIGFSHIDKIALATGITTRSPIRILAASKFILNKWSEEGGHTIMPLENFIDQMSSILTIEKEELRNGSFSFGLYKFSRSTTIDNINKTEEFVGGQDYVKESLIAEWFKKHNKKIIFNGSVPKSVIVSGNNISIDQTQLKAVNDALTNKIHVITGGPGTGKTTIIAAYIKGLESSGIKNIILAAPTGKAARRMEEATGISAYTIHKLLFEGGGSTISNANAIIIDEISMADVDLIYSLTKNITENTRVLVVGDSFQLPSIGPGNILRDIIKSNKVPVSVLTTIYRQGNGSWISVAADNIKNGLLPKAAPPDVTFISTRDRFESLDKIVEQYINAYTVGLDVQVLTAMHKGECGTVIINKEIQEKLHKNKEFIIYKNNKFYVGDKIIHTKNDYNLGVMNGEVGFITDIKEVFCNKLGKKIPEIVAEIDGRYVIYKGSDIDMLKLAYALSVHKSQGSEYSRVILSVDKSQMFMLERHWLYTAVTRAKRTLILVGQTWAIKSGLEKIDSKDRMTALSYLLSDTE